MKLYSELADWFHLLTAPASYAEEAAIYGELMVSRASGPVRRVLELGSGGGNNASHMSASRTDTVPETRHLYFAENPTFLFGVDMDLRKRG